MVDDTTANFVYFSEIFIKNFRETFLNIIDVLDYHLIRYNVLKNTRDIWCNDFMPHQVDREKYIQFIYHPHYLKNKPEYITDASKIQIDLEITKWVTFPVVLEGGNIIRRSDKMILNELVFEENRPYFNTQEIFDLFHEYFLVSNITVVPKQSVFNNLNQANRMTRFINDREILVNDFSMETNSFNQKLQQYLGNSEFSLVKMNYSKDFLDAFQWGDYLGFVQVKNLILVPLYNHPEDKVVLKKLKLLFPKQEVKGIICPEYIRKRGGFNRLLWKITV